MDYFVYRMVHEMVSSWYALICAVTFPHPEPMPSWHD